MTAAALTLLLLASGPACGECERLVRDANPDLVHLMRQCKAADESGNCESVAREGRARYAAAIEGQKEQHRAKRELLVAECDQRVATAVSLANSRATQAAILSCEHVRFAADDDSRIDRAITRAKAELRRIAAIHTTSAEVLFARGNLCDARAEMAKAMSANPYDPVLAKRYEEVSEACIRETRRKIADAKAFETVTNYQKYLRELRDPALNGVPPSFEMRCRGCPGDPEGRDENPDMRPFKTDETTK